MKIRLLKVKLAVAYVLVFNLGNTH